MHLLFLSHFYMLRVERGARAALAVLRRRTGTAKGRAKSLLSCCMEEQGHGEAGARGRIGESSAGALSPGVDSVQQRTRTSEFSMCGLRVEIVTFAAFAHVI